MNEFACFGLSIVAISYTISTHEVSHSRARFGNKMYISELFTVVGYLHTAGFKNCRGINCAKCIIWNNKTCNKEHQCDIRVPTRWWLRSLLLRFDLRIIDDLHISHNASGMGANIRVLLIRNSSSHSSLDVNGFELPCLAATMCFTRLRNPW